jgi:hypothetical protein
MRAGGRKKIGETNGARAATSCARTVGWKRAAAARRACGRCRVKSTCAARSCCQEGGWPQLFPGIQYCHTVAVPDYCHTAVPRYC